MNIWQLISIFALVMILSCTIIIGCDEEDEDSEADDYTLNPSDDDSSSDDDDDNDDDVTCDGYETKWDQMCEDEETFAVSCGFQDNTDNCKLETSFCHDLYVCYFDCYEMWDQCADFIDCVEDCASLA